MDTIKELLLKKKVLLFGAGYYGRQILNFLGYECQVLAFIDNDKNKVGKMIDGIDIVLPNDISNYRYDMIIISFPRNKDEIIQSLVEQYNVPMNKICDYSSIKNYDVRIASLRGVAKEIYEKNLEGNIAEVGVYKGEFARVMNSVFPDKKCYLFDTFAGFSSEDVVFDVRNRLSESENSFEGKYCNEDINLVLTSMEHPEQCVIKKGMFPETVAGLEDKFVFVSLDVDLYKPIYSGLKYFYPRMVSGGYIFVHDYNNPMFSGVKKAVKDFSLETNIKSIPLCDLYGSLIIVK